MTSKKLVTIGLFVSLVVTAVLGNWIGFFLVIGFVLGSFYTFMQMRSELRKAAPNLSELYNKLQIEVKGE